MPAATIQNLPAGNLRLIRKEDNSAVASIIREILTSFGCTGPGFAIHDPEVDAMFEAYQLPRSRYFVMERDGEVVGCSGVAPLEGSTHDMCELRKLYVLEKARGFGYGRQLMDVSLEAAKEFGFECCYIETLPFMKTATVMYENAGFTRIDGPMGNTGHHGCDRWYIKAL